MARRYGDEELVEIEREWRALVEDQTVTYLLADPSVVGRKAIFNALSKAGCERILEVKNGKELFATLEKQPGRVVALIELDLKDTPLPRLVKKLAALPNLPKISLLFSAQDFSREQLLALTPLGPKAYLKRPLDPEAVLAKLAELALL